MEHEHHHGHQPEQLKDHQHPVASEKSAEHHPSSSIDHHHDGHATHDGYDKHAGHHTADFLKRFWICLVLTVPVLLLSHVVQQWIGFHISFAGDKYLLTAISTFIYVYGGWPFLTGMINELRYRNIGMMTLVALAITVAFIYSVAVVFGLQGMDFFWELATLIDIMLLGHWLEMRSVMAASRALESLVALLPSNVHVERNGSIVDIDLKDLNNNEVVLIKPGEKIPADGIVIEGHSTVNESMLTGESKPVEKDKDDTVIGGAVNGDGSIKIRVTGAGKDSYLTKVINLVQSAQNARSQTQNLADKVAKWLTIISIVIGAATFFYWISVEQNISFALERMVTVMVTACPHALGVAIPLVVALSTSISARNGLLIRNRTAFESARKITTVIFDKTGTLTKGSHEVQKVISLNNKYSENDVLMYAAAVQQNSEHHIAHGIMTILNNKNLQLYKSEKFHAIKGMGVTATVNGKEVVVAGPNYFKDKKIDLPAIPGSIDQDVETVNFVLINNEPVGIITLADAVRESSAQAIQELKEMNIKSFLLTGDNEKIAANVARELSMDGFMANVLPHEKQIKVKELQAKGETVAMTGDGVNDAPALAQSDVGIAIGSGTDVAAETADIILVNSDPKDVAQIISFGRATYKKMVQNLAWAVGYNVIAIPLAAGILYPHFLLSPALGAVLMSLSTVIVAVNANFLQLKSKQ